MTFVAAVLFTADLSQATVVTIYLLNRATMKWRDRLLNLRPGTRIVSHAESMGEWRADHFEMFDVKDKFQPDAPTRPTPITGWFRRKSRAHGIGLDRTPAGTEQYELRLAQNFQKVSGVLRVNGDEFTIEDGRLDGERMNVRFSPAGEGALRYRLDGRVMEDGAILGTLSILGDDSNAVPVLSSLKAVVR